MFNAINLYLYKVFILIILIKYISFIVDKISSNVNTNENKFNNQLSDFKQSTRQSFLIMNMKLQFKTTKLLNLKIKLI